MAKQRVFLCGGDETPGPRADCPNELHDWPLPAGYSDSHAVANRRLRNKWRTRKCPDCKLYGWEPGEDADESDRRHYGESRDPSDTYCI